MVEIPVTDLVRDLLRGETAGGDPVTGSYALLTIFEPLSIEYASFLGLDGTAAGGGASQGGAGAGDGSPELRIILNFARGGN